MSTSIRSLRRYLSALMMPHSWKCCLFRRLSSLKNMTTHLKFTSLFCSRQQTSQSNSFFLFCKTILPIQSNLKVCPAWSHRNKAIRIWHKSDTFLKDRTKTQTFTRTGFQHLCISSLQCYTLKRNCSFKDPRLIRIIPKK